MQVLTSILISEAVALVVLLICGMLVHRTFPQRYLMLWNVGWLLYAGHIATVGFIPGARAELVSVLPLLAGCALMTAALALAAGGSAPPVFLWGVVAAGFIAHVALKLAAPAYA